MAVAVKEPPVLQMAPAVVGPVKGGDVVVGDLLAFVDGHSGTHLHMKVLMDDIPEIGSFMNYLSVIAC